MIKMTFLHDVRLPDGKAMTIQIDHETGKIYRLLGPGLIGHGHYGVINGNGYLALPGFIDPHVHFRQPGMEHKATWQTESVAAIKGGVTTVFDMPNTNPALTTHARIQEKVNMIGQVPVDYRFWFGATKNNLDELPGAQKDPRIIGLKVYMGSSTGDLLVDDEESLRKVFERAAQCDLLVGVHAENEALMKWNRDNLGHEARVQDHCYIRETSVEVSAVTCALRLQKETGCRLYFCHITTPEAVELIAVAKNAGRPVYVEVCPHHLSINVEEILVNGNPLHKMNPPLRTPKQSAKLLAYVCQDGFVDCLGSDHAPHLLSEKKAGEYDKVPSGVTGVQTLGMFALTRVANQQLSLSRLVDLTSARAAKIFGLPDKGAIEVGKDADIVLVDLHEQHTFINDQVASKCGWSPFDGWNFTGSIKLTIAKGIPYIP